MSKVNREKIINAYIEVARHTIIAKDIIKKDIHRIKSSNTKNAAKIYQSFLRYLKNNNALHLSITRNDI